MAVRDYFLKDKHVVSIDGNQEAKAFEILTGEKPINLVSPNITSFENKKNSNEIIIDIRQKLDLLIGKKDLLAECNFVTDFYRTEPKTIADLDEVIYTAHAYTLKRVEKDFIYIINPHDTSKDIKIDRHSFEKYCGGVTLLNL